MARPPAAIVLSEEEKAELEKLESATQYESGAFIYERGVVLDCARGYTGEGNRQATPHQPADGVEVAGAVRR